MAISKHTLTIEKAWEEAETARTNKDFKKADLILAQILAKTSAHAPSLVSQGMLLVHVKRYDDALLNATKAIAIDENYLPTYQLACLAYNNKGQMPLANTWCGRGLAKFPNDPFLLYYQARIYAETGKIEEAMSYCQQALAAKPDFDLAFRLHEFMRQAAA